MNRDAMFHQTTQVTVDQLMVSDRVCRTSKFRSQVVEVWVIGRRVDRHTCAGEQDELTPFLCVILPAANLHREGAFSSIQTNPMGKLIVPEKSAFVQVSRTELDWLVGMSHGRLWGVIGRRSRFVFWQNHL